MQSVVRLPSIAAEPDAAPRSLTAAGLLVDGGDRRIVLDETTGLNRYGCQPHPDPQALAFGSSTASVISPTAFSGVERLAGRLSRALADGADPAALYAEEIGRVRGALTSLLGLADMDGLRVVIGRSGTDLHNIVAKLIGAGVAAPPLVIASEAEETGSGVAAALGGAASAGAALRTHAAGLPPFGAAWPCQVMQVAARAADGAARPADQVDDEVAAAARAAAAIGRRVLLILMDCSKTGLISPSVDCALTLKRQFPDHVEVLVDACQLRLAPATVRAYLAADCLVAVTGSKFMTGPTFSGALLAPDAAARRLGAHGAPPALGVHCMQADFPPDWPGCEVLPAKANFGLLARWQAALEQMAPFVALDPARVHGFFDALAQAVGAHLDADPRLERVDQRPLDRAALGVGDRWDRVQTIHPFALRGGDGLLGAEDTLGLYRLSALDLGGWARAASEPRAVQTAASLRLQLGQPVLCGQRGGRPISALRLCASARLATDALTPGGPGVQAAIDQALTALDKTAWLCGRMTSGGV